MTPSERSGRPGDDLQDEALAALYRQAAREEPPPRHDAAILAAAAAELARPAGARRSWWQRWRMGLSVAATVVLSAGIVLLVEREQAGSPAGEPPAAEQSTPRPPQRMEAAPSPSAKEAPIPQTPPAIQRRDWLQEEGRKADSPRPAEPRGQAASRDAAEAPAKAKGSVSAPPPASPAPPRQSGNAAREEDRAGVAASAPASKPVSPSPEELKSLAQPERAPSADSASSVTAPKGGTPSSASPASSAPAPLAAPSDSSQETRRSMAAPSTQDAAGSPQHELAEIRALLQAGRTEEARTALGVFLRRHPDFALPPDLEALRPNSERRMR